MSDGDVAADTLRLCSGEEERTTARLARSCMHIHMHSSLGSNRR